MTNREITSKIDLIKENYQNGNITGDDLCELLSDLVCEIEECEGAFGMGFGEDDHYGSFEETDFTKLENI
jgi:hypothetical protein